MSVSFREGLAARLAQVQDLLNCPYGPLISPEDALRLLDMPDVTPAAPERAWAEAAELRGRAVLLALRPR